MSAQRRTAREHTRLSSKVTERACGGNVYASFPYGSSDLPRCTLLRASAVSFVAHPHRRSLLTVPVVRWPPCRKQRSAPHHKPHHPPRRLKRERRWGRLQACPPAVHGGAENWEHDEVLRTAPGKTCP